MQTRNLMQAALGVALAAASALAFAQQVDPNNGPVTRAEVKAQLQQLEAAGYRPEGEDASYPADIQAAEARVSQQQGMAQAPAPSDTGYGPATSGTTQSGAPAMAPAQPGGDPNMQQN
jgi:hypothetical protein